MSAVPRDFKAWLQQPLPAQPSSALLSFTDPRLPVLVVGAGPAGLAAMARLHEAGIPFKGADRGPSVGGLWNAANPDSAAYDSLVTNSSKATTHLSLPLPADAPPFFPRQQAEDYFHRFAAHHQLLPHISFSTTVQHVTKTLGGTNTWQATLHHDPSGASSTAEYRAVIVAVGPQSRLTANIPAELSQQATAAGIPFIHASAYRNPSGYEGRSVLIVGMGNSASEIATEVSRVTKRCLIAVRTTPWIVPLSIFGTPADVVGGRSVGPYALQIGLFHVLQRLWIGHPSSLGFPKPPDHAILDRQPVVDRGIVKAIRTHRVELRQNVTRITAAGVSFEDTPSPPESVDAVIFATGYRREYPFLPECSRHPFEMTLQLTLFHATETGLLFMPEINVPRGGWPTCTAQAEALVQYLLADARQSRRCAELNERRGLPSPDIKGQMFKAADKYHADPKLYLRLMSDFASWMAEEGK